LADAEQHQRQLIFATPQTKEREYIAGACVRNWHQDSSVLDEFGNGQNERYTVAGSIYLIDGQGRIAFKTKPGPFGF